MRGGHVWIWCVRMPKRYNVHIMHAFMVGMYGYDACAMNDNWGCGSADGEGGGGVR